MEPENQPLEKEIPFEPIIFRFHVKLWGCTQKKSCIVWVGHFDE